MLVRRPSSSSRRDQRGIRNFYLTAITTSIGNRRMILRSRHDHFRIKECRKVPIKDGWQCLRFCARKGFLSIKECEKELIGRHHAAQKRNDQINHNQRQYRTKEESKCKQRKHILSLNDEENDEVANQRSCGSTILLILSLLAPQTIRHRIWKRPENNARSKVDG